MRNYMLYPTSTGHTIVSPVNLDYAMNAQHQVDIQSIAPADFKKVNVFVDYVMAHTMLDLLEKKSWRTAEEAIASPSAKDVCWEGDYCVVQGSTVYIRNGRRYEPLDTVIEKSDKNMLSVALRFVANQAAHCQAAVAKLLCERKLDSAE